MSNQKRLIIGITGASGIIYGIRLLEVLRDMPIETHLIVSRAGHQTRAYETDLSRKDLNALADVTYADGDIGAAIASGSVHTFGMIIAPCSMRTLGEIAAGTCGTLVSRSADVVLKERRRLVLLPRETPLHAGHLENMLKVTQMGGVIAPPVPAFYTKPTTIADIVDHTVGRALDLFELDHSLVNRWS